MNYTLSNSKNFLILAFICCFLSVITTIGIHSSLFDLGNLNFEQRLQLFKNSTYMANRFWVIIHCLFVLIAMWGFFLVQFKKAPGFTGLGFVFFSVFSFTEIFRQMFVFFYLNNLRKSYLATNNTSTQDMIQINMEHASLIGYALFGLFIVAFALGNICYGLSLLKGDKVDRVLAYLMLFWGVGNLIAFANEFWQSPALQIFLEYFSVFYQPFMRTLVGFWLLRKYKQLD